MRDYNKIKQVMHDIITECEKVDEMEQKGISVESTKQERDYIVEEMKSLISNESLLQKTTWTKSHANASKGWDWAPTNTNTIYILLVKLARILEER